MTIVPAQIEFAERAKAARKRMEKAAIAPNKVAAQKTIVIDVMERCRQQRARKAALDAERLDRILARYRLAASSLANPKAVITRIKSECAEKHGVTVAKIDGPRRSEKIVHARQEAMWRAKNETNLSFPSLGKLFDRDHTTVMWGIRQHEARMAGTSISRVGGMKVSLARQKEAT